MLVVLKSNYEELSREAARIVANAVRHNPTIRLGLATGSTTLGVYRELVRLHRDEGLDFSRVLTFNLDEYLGVSPEHPHSFHNFMLKNFFSQVNIDPRNIHIPDGTITADYENYCAAYEHDIQGAGGIDLQILGIGRNTTYELLATGKLPSVRVTPRRIVVTNRALEAFLGLEDPRVS